MRKLLITLVLLAVFAIMSSKTETIAATAAASNNKVATQASVTRAQKNQGKPQGQEDEEEHQEKQEKEVEKKIMTAPLTVTGQATTTVFAGLIQIGIEFTTIASCSTEALNENTAKVKNALRELRKFGCNEESIATVYFGMNPKYKQCEEEKHVKAMEKVEKQEHTKPCQAEIEGHIITQTIEITISSKKQAAKIIDTLGGCGGVLLWVHWETSEKAEKIAKTKLIKNAVDDAVFQARKTAKRFGFKLQSVKSVRLEAIKTPENQTFKTFNGITLVGINKTMSLAVTVEFEMMKVQIIKKDDCDEKDEKEQNN